MWVFDSRGISTVQHMPVPWSYQKFFTAFCLYLIFVLFFSFHSRKYFLTYPVTFHRYIIRDKINVYDKFFFTTNVFNQIQILKYHFRSWESLQAFMDVEPVEEKNNNALKASLQRSNSTIEDRNRGRNNKKLLRSNSKLSDCSHQLNNIRQKIKSVEYLPNSNASTIFIEELNDYSSRYPNGRRGSRNNRCAGSVPDLKKVFISEYI